VKEQPAVDDLQSDTTLAFVRAESTLSGRLSQPLPMDLVAAAGLAGVVEELGYPCTQNEAAFANVLKQFRGLDETAVAGLLGMMVRTHSSLEDRQGTQVWFEKLETSICCVLLDTALASLPLAQHQDLSSQSKMETVDFSWQPS